MSQIKKKTTPPGKEQAAKKSVLSWQTKRDDNRNKLIGIIAVLGVVAVLAGYFLQASGVFGLGSDAETAADSGIRLNEIVAQNRSSLVTEAGEVPDWVEIINTGSEAVNLYHYGLMLESNINNMYYFPNYMIEAGECLVIRCEGGAGDYGNFSAPFKLKASGGDRLILLNANGKAVDAVSLCELSADEAYARQADGSWQIKLPTPGAGNDTAVAATTYDGVEVKADDIVLSEVSSANTLYFADENGEKHDYVELHNTGSKDINLKGWYLSDSSDKLKRWSFPDVILPAGGYLAVHCSGYDRIGDAGHLHTDFKLSDGESVYLCRPDGSAVSVTEVPALAPDQAWLLVNGIWGTDIAPTPGEANTESAAARVNLRTFGDKTHALRINEIMASPVNENYDWVEIYNGTAQAVDLSGYGLSDSPDKPRKWQFPAGTYIQPGQYMGVFLSGMSESSFKGYLNADFALAAEGGYTVCLSDPSGNVLDAAYLGQQYGGISYGRTDGGSGFYLFENATPIAANAQSGYRGRAAQAEVSVKGGLYNNGDRFLVELSAPAGARIYYTLDCADPSERSILYTGPVEISSTTILRSRVYQDGCMPSLIDTQSYLYDVSNDSNVYVVSVVSDNENLYGEGGVISNTGRDIEREAHVEIFKANGESVISQGCGITLHGQSTRKLPIKSFKLIARNEYGGNRFEYPIFSRRDYNEYQSVLLRPSGEDYNMSFVRDSLLSQLVRDTSVFYQEYEICVCYLNGEYYTLYYLRERINKYSICQFEGWLGMEDEIDIVKGNDVVVQGSDESFAALLEWVKKNDTTTDTAYDYIAGKIDVDNYIEYMSIQIFSGNTDTLNIRRYRNKNTDGKWKWALFDLDWAFYNDTNSIRNWLTPGGTGSSKATDNTLFIACMRNPIFREKFLVYFGEQMATNFSTENVVALMEERYAILEGVLPQYKEKWGLTLAKGPRKLLQYAEERPDKLLNTYFKEFFRFSDAEMEKYFGEALDKIEEYAAGK